MARKLFGLFGAGGFAREVMPFVQHAVGPEMEVCFVDAAAADDLNGVPVMAEADFLAADADLYFNIAIGDSRVREKIAARLEGRATPLTLSDRDSRFLAANEIGEGAIFCPFSMVTSNARIGRFFHANLYAYVAHDCVIGDFVTFAPGVKCNGNVVIEDHAYVGTGAVIRNGEPGRPLVIGAGAVVGMGAVVTKDVRAGAVVMGSPAAERSR